MQVFQNERSASTRVTNARPEPVTRAASVARSSKASSGPVSSNRVAATAASRTESDSAAGRPSGRTPPAKCTPLTTGPATPSGPVRAHSKSRPHPPRQPSCRPPSLTTISHVPSVIGRHMLKIAVGSPHHSCCHPDPLGSPASQSLSPGPSWSPRRGRRPAPTPRGGSRPAGRVGASGGSRAARSSRSARMPSASVNLVAGQVFACRLTEAGLFGELRVWEPPDLLDRGLCAVRLLIQCRITRVRAWPCPAFAAQGQVVERLKPLSHPVLIHGPHSRRGVRQFPVSPARQSQEQR